MSTQNRKEMVRAYKEAKPAFGVFALECVASGEVWIGSSANLAAQENAVRFTLKMGTHPNKGLEKAIKAHGPEAFGYRIVEAIEDEDLTPMGRTDLLKRRVAHWVGELSAKPLIGAV